MTFVDLYAGCGGVSLGLMRAGMRGLFAVEKEQNAFWTLKHNLLAAENETRFYWPMWLPQEPITVEAFLRCRKHEFQISNCSGLRT